MYFSDQPIIEDFNRFLAYLRQAGAVELTKGKALLRAADLEALNAQMHDPVVLKKNKPTQQDFILLNTFFHIGACADLWWPQRAGKDKFRLTLNTERIVIYDSMTDDERYGFLLQAFWCYLDRESAYNQRVFYGVGFFYENLPHFEPEKPITIKGTKIRNWFPKHLATMLTAFGLLRFTLDPKQKQEAGSYLVMETITLTESGKKILPILDTERSEVMWTNLDPYMTPALWEKIYEDDPDPNYFPPELSDFFEAFLPAFPGLRIATRLFPIERTIVQGIFSLKIALYPDCYRIIHIRSEATWDYLQTIIQDIFQFDNDHLYAFYLNGKQQYKEGNVVSDHREEFGTDGYPANLITLGETALKQGQEVLYIFDFGDNWEFRIEVLDILQAPDKPAKNKASWYTLIQSEGEAPKQYGRYDDEGDFEEDWEEYE